MTSIAVSPTNPNVAYLTVGELDVPSVFKTSDGGQSWQNIENNLPASLPVQSVAVNPLNDQMIYLGTDAGVFESIDGGASWRVANQNFASTSVSDLEFRPGTTELYAFTYGRGIYKVDVGR